MNELCLRHSVLKYHNSHARFGLRREAQTVERDASNIKAVSSNLTSVKEFYPFPFLPYNIIL